MHDKSEPLDQLEYPRLMHGPNRTNRRVENLEQADEAARDGFTVHRELDDAQEKAVAAADKKAPKGDRSRASQTTDQDARSSVSQPIEPHKGNAFGPEKK